MEVTKDELNLIRQWFDAVQDALPKYLMQDDYRLAIRIYEDLVQRVPHSILDGAKPPKLNPSPKTQWRVTAEGFVLIREF